jgi:hypothetical protein
MVSDLLFVGIAASRPIMLVPVTHDLVCLPILALVAVAPTQGAVDQRDQEYYRTDEVDNLHVTLTNLVDRS